MYTIKKKIKIIITITIINVHPSNSGKDFTTNLLYN